MMAKAAAIELGISRPGLTRTPVPHKGLSVGGTHVRLKHACHLWSTMNILMTYWKCYQSCK